MRQARIKIPPAVGEAIYHCMSKTVNGEWLFDDTAKEILRRQIWQVADYCGVQVVTYTVMSNHFHVLVRVPQAAPVADAELLRRYGVLYPHPTPFQMARRDVIAVRLTQDGPEAADWRKHQLRLMGDVSQYMKLVKQRFSTWFNKAHGRFGTLWCERFKSVLLGPGALGTMATYIDLNSVRAGLVADPKDYRFCGYADAVAGHAPARAGLQSLAGEREWGDAQAAYRERLFGVGTAPRAGAASISPTDAATVFANQGQLPLAAVLRCRIRHFTDGAVLGTRAFVEEQWEAYRRRFGRRENLKPRALPANTDWGDLAILRRLKNRSVVTG